MKIKFLFFIVLFKFFTINTHSKCIYRIYEDIIFEVDNIFTDKNINKFLCTESDSETIQAYTTNRKYRIINLSKIQDLQYKYDSNNRYSFNYRILYVFPYNLNATYSIDIIIHDISIEKDKIKITAIFSPLLPMRSIHKLFFALELFYNINNSNSIEFDKKNIIDIDRWDGIPR